MTPSPDDALVRRLRAGEAQALGEFLEACRPRLTAFVERNLGAALRRKAEPQDVFQETAVYALNALPHTDLSQRDPFGWLCQIAEQRIIDLHRKFFGRRSAPPTGNRRWTPRPARPANKCLSTCWW